ncbi:hypothetical protein [Streptomyces sp. V4I2]|uniref:hypothetical protein n=1 Tax=Streptomyces sp. V4I2 TaxID=3042280 RepID=UPI00277EE79A|nr:hypothetical protein [Streptomyces sp. V4I2]MDQ1050197.1 hypothetical protein [Streptomyces sp. V4I2]
MTAIRTSVSPRGHTRVVVTTSWDDGHRIDACLVASLDKYCIAGTFYIASRNREFAPAEEMRVGTGRPDVECVPDRSLFEVPVP